VEESLERLGLDRLQLVYLHDPEKISFEAGTAAGGPLEALLELRDQGVIRHLGVAGGPIDLELKYLATGVFDVVISHNRYTLVDQTAESRSSRTRWSAGWRTSTRRPSAAECS
jgi:D-threo-aldose 1-dehydrogenase